MGFNFETRSSMILFYDVIDSLLRIDHPYSKKCLLLVFSFPVLLIFSLNCIGRKDLIELFCEIVYFTYFDK